MRPCLLLALLAALVVGCSTTRGGTPTTAARHFTHGARDLEALLPDRVEGVPLEKASTTGAIVFGGDAFSRSMARFLRSAGRKPRDLRSATAVDLSNRVDVEVGVFEVRGIGSPRLERAIIAASRPSAPGLRVSRTTVSGRPVTTLLYPGSSLLYLHRHADDVFYVGSQDPKRAEKIVAGLP